MPVGVPAGVVVAKANAGLLAGVVAEVVLAKEKLGAADLVGVEVDAAVANENVGAAGLLGVAAGVVVANENPEGAAGLADAIDVEGLLGKPFVRLDGSGPQSNVEAAGAG